MKKKPEVEEIVEKGLDQISSAGEFVGESLGSVGRTAQKILIGGGILVIFGIAAFIWALAKGLLKRK